MRRALNDKNFVVKMGKEKTSWKKAAGTMRVAGVRLKKTNETMKCFILDCQNGLTLVQPFDFDARFCGYTVISDETIDGVKIYEENSLLDTFARLRRFKPRPLEGIALDSFSAVLESLGERFPLITITCRKRGEKLTGKIIGRTKNKFSFKIIDEEGFWRDKTKDFSFKDITQITVGSGLENALTIISEQRQPKKRIILHEISKA